MPPLTDRRQIILALVLTIGLLVAACSSEPNQGSDPGIVESTTPPGSSLASSNPPDPIKAVMSKPRYRNATWSLLATDMKTGQSFIPSTLTRGRSLARPASFSRWARL